MSENKAKVDNKNKAKTVITTASVTLTDTKALPPNQPTTATTSTAVIPAASTTALPPTSVTATGVNVTPNTSPLSPSATSTTTSESIKMVRDEITHTMSVLATHVERILQDMPQNKSSPSQISSGIDLVTAFLFAAAIKNNLLKKSFLEQLEYHAAKEIVSENKGTQWRCYYMERNISVQPCPSCTRCTSTFGGELPSENFSCCKCHADLQFCFEDRRSCIIDFHQKIVTRYDETTTATTKTAPDTTSDLTGSSTEQNVGTSR